MKIAIYSTALTKFTKKLMFMRKTIQKSFIQTLSQKYVPFKSRSTNRQLSGQHVYVTFSVAEVFWVLNDALEYVK